MGNVTIGATLVNEQATEVLTHSRSPLGQSLLKICKYVTDTELCINSCNYSMMKTFLLFVTDHFQIMHQFPQPEVRLYVRKYSKCMKTWHEA